MPSGQCRRTIAGLTARDKRVPTPIGLRGLRDQCPSAKLSDSLDPCRGLSTIPASTHAPPWLSIPGNASSISYFHFARISRFRRDSQLTPRRHSHHPRRRPRHISPAARLPSNQGFGGIPRSLSVLPLDGHAEVIPTELAPRVRHPVPKQLIPARRHSA